MNEVSNVKKNFIISIVTQIITVSFSLIVPRLMISHYGAELHGLTSVITGLITYLTLIEAGFGAASLQSLYKPLQEKDLDKINGCLNEITIFYKKIGSIFSILVILISLIYPLVAADNLPYLFVMILIIVSGLAQTIEFFFCSKYKLLLQADKRLYVLNTVNSVATIMQGILRIIMIVLNSNIILVQLIPAIVYVCRLLLIKDYVNKLYKYLDKTIKPIKSVGDKKWNVLIHQISNLVVNNTDSIVLSTFVGYTSVSIYSIYSMITNNINGFLNQALSNAITANFGHLVSEGDNHRINNIFSSYEKIYNYIIVVIFSVVMVLIVPFVQLYTESITKIQYANYFLAFLFVINAILSNLRIPYLTMVNATGTFKETQNHALLEAAINIIISILLVKYIGIYGVLIGTTISFLVRDCLFVWFVNKKILNREIINSLTIIMRSVVLILIVVFVNKYIVSYVFSMSWLTWILCGFLAIIITSIIVVCYILIFDKNSMTLIKKFLKLN